MGGRPALSPLCLKERESCSCQEDDAFSLCQLQGPSALQPGLPDAALWGLGCRWCRQGSSQHARMLSAAASIPVGTVAPCVF